MEARQTSGGNDCPKGLFRPPLIDRAPIFDCEHQSNRIPPQRPRPQLLFGLTCPLAFQGVKYHGGGNDGPGLATFRGLEKTGAPVFRAGELFVDGDGPLGEVYRVPSEAQQFGQAQTSKDRHSDKVLQLTPLGGGQQGSSLLIVQGLRFLLLRLWQRTLKSGVPWDIVQLHSLFQCVVKDSIYQPNGGRRETRTGVWIAELGELESTLKKEQTSLKSFITQKVDTIRAPYAAEKVDRPRHTSFGATVNPDRFLKDDTGDRRFWVVPVRRINLDKLLELPPDWVSQLWAEVYIWWMRDPQGFRLSCMELEHLNELNQQFREMLPGEEEIRLTLDWALPPEQWRDYTASDIKLKVFLGERTTVQQIGRVLAKLAREEKNVTVTPDPHSKVKSYKLPLSSDFADTAESNL